MLPALPRPPTGYCHPDRKRLCPVIASDHHVELGNKMATMAGALPLQPSGIIVTVVTALRLVDHLSHATLFGN